MHLQNHELHLKNANVARFGVLSGSCGARLNE